MARFTPEPPEDAEIESCYPDKNGVYVPWSEIAAQIDAKWDRIEWRERILSVIGGILFIVAASYVLVKTGIIDRGSAPSQSQSRSPSAPAR